MHTQRATPTLREHGKIAASLRGFHHAEGILLPGNEDVDRVVASDLQKNAGVRAAFVSLAGGMKEARAKTENGGDFFVVAHGETNGLQRFFMRFVHGDVAEHAEIITCSDAFEMLFKEARQRAAALERGGIFQIGVELAAIAGE